MLKRTLASFIAAASWGLLALPAHAGHWVLDHVKITDVSALEYHQAHSTVSHSVTSSAGNLQVSYAGHLTANSNTMVDPDGIVSTGQQEAVLNLAIGVKYYVNWIADYPGEPMPSTATGIGTVHDSFSRGTNVQVGAGPSSTAYGAARTDYAGYSTSESFSDAFLATPNTSYWNTPSHSDSGNAAIDFGFYLNNDVGESGTHVCDSIITVIESSVLTDSYASGLSFTSIGLSDLNMTGYFQLETIDSQPVGTP